MQLHTEEMYDGSSLDLQLLILFQYQFFCLRNLPLFCFLQLQNLNLIIKVAVKMKNSKSQKNITVITDRKAQHDLLMSCSSSSLSKGIATCTNRPQTSPYHRSRLPSTTKNKTEIAQQNHFISNNMSGQKPSRQRSNSTKSRQNSLSRQTRKKQLDLLCFQRMVNQFKKYLIEHEQIWDLNFLCYEQLIKLLWLCRYIPYFNQQQFIRNNQQGELKKVYCLWLSISIKKMVNYRDFLIFMQIMQNINVDQEKIDSTLSNLQDQLKNTNGKNYESFQQDPNYTFFLKRMQLQRKNNRLQIDSSTKQKIISYFKSFKFTKLKQSGLFQCVKVQQQPITFSKKTNQLAQQKRRKIQDKIREKKPHVENINLLDLLSYRERDHLQNTKKQAQPKKKKNSVHYRRGQLKKQIQLLSRPKMHFDERKQDQIIFQKQQQQFTFHPKIHSFKNDTKDKVLKVKNADKVLIRMKQARQMKQQKKDMMKKGWSNNSKNIQQTKANYKIKQLILPNDANKQNVVQDDQIPKSIEKQKQQLQKPKNQKLTKYEVSKDYLRIPILYIDVNIEQGKKERIIIYDNDKAKDLAHQFGQKHKLSQETIGRLELLLQQQMDTVLARIEEETDDECSIIY